MIRKVLKNDLDECVKVIRSSFQTVADEFGVYRGQCAEIYGVCDDFRTVALPLRAGKKTDVRVSERRWDRRILFFMEAKWRRAYRHGEI